MEIKIRHLLMVLSRHPGLKIGRPDSCERFDDNKRFIKRRLQFETTMSGVMKFQSDHYICRDSYRCVQAIPGAVGRRMTLLLLEYGVYSESVYKQACEKAVNIVNAEKVTLLQEQAK